MPKAVTINDFQPQNQNTPANNTMANMDKINTMLDKGLALFDKIQTLMKYKQMQNQQGDANSQIEVKAEKMANRMVAQQTAEVQYRDAVVKVDYKVEEAVNNLDVILSKLSELGIDTNRTLKQFIEEDYPKFKQAGYVHMGIETILKKFVEVKKE